MKYETRQSFRSPPDASRATPLTPRGAFVRPLYPAPWPAPAGQHRRSISGRHRSRPRLPPRYRSQHYPRLRGRGIGRSEGEVRPAAPRSADPRRRLQRALASAAAPGPTGLRQARIRVCPLPSKRPWLNPSAPKGVQGKRASVEPEQWLRAAEVERRAWEYYGCAQQEHLQQTDPPRMQPTKRKKVA
jgi:hypothetical protein